MTLSVQTYNSYEREAIHQLPNRVIEAFQPTEFYNTGYPTRIEKEKELWKYIDVMQIKRYERNINNELGGLSEEEFRIYQEVTEKISVFTQKYFNELFVARNSVSRSFIVYRAIRQIYKGYKPTVYEIGPGCGYLGALIIQEGWKYYAMDNTQAFYLYQNHLWNHFTNNNLCEALGKTSDYRTSNAVHIPWWNFFLHNNPENIDLITCNHMLIEMNPIALKYTVRKMRDILKENKDKQSKYPKLVVFEHWGGGTTNTRANVFKEFMDVGFRLIYHGSFTDNIEAPITVFALKDNYLADSFYVPPHPLIQAIKDRSVRSLIRYLINKLKGESEKNYEPPSPADNFKQNSYISNLLKIPPINVDIDQINQFYRSVNKGISTLYTKDEEFYDYIDQKH
jgi:hypothetical protein